MKIEDGKNNVKFHDSKKINPTEFKKRLDLIKEWFEEFNDDQKNLTLKSLLDVCGTSQNHILSTLMEPILHRHCPEYCQDPFTKLPRSICLHIMTFLDPVSLCRCSQVNWMWRHLATDQSLWRRLCLKPTWGFSKICANKQLTSITNAIEWKNIFAERYRLSHNWLKGYCNVRTFEGHTQAVFCVQFDDKRIVSGSSDKTIKVWNIRTNSSWAVMTLVGHSGTVRCLDLKGNRLVSGSTDNTIKVWDLSTEGNWTGIACKVTMIGHTQCVRCLQVDNEKVVSGSYDFTLKIWDLSTGHCRMTLRGHEGPVLCLKFDDQKIISGSSDTTLKIWKNGLCISSLKGHQDSVTCVEFDATKVISGSLDRMIKFWSLETGECITSLDWMKSEGHTRVIRCLQADNWRIVSGGDDKILKVWDVKNGQRIVSLKNHTDGITCLQFNDRIIVSGSYDQTVKLWDFSI